MPVQAFAETRHNTTNLARDLRNADLEPPANDTRNSLSDGSVGDVVERVRVRTGAAVLTPVERGDLFYVTWLELEVEQREVLLDP